MDRFLTATEARQQFLKLLDEVREGQRVIITRRGKPTAAVIDFERLLNISRRDREGEKPPCALHQRKERSLGRVCLVGDGK